MKKVLVLDNYDSFTYNLVHILCELGFESEMTIARNDKISLEEVDEYSSVLLSPGPGLPGEAGIMPDLIRKFAGSKNILGVCLGHQGIGEAFGAKLFNLPQVLHGVVSDVRIVGQDLLFEGMPERFDVCRYHSWIIDRGGLPDDLVVTAVDDEDRIMAIKHRQYNVRGVQFHPESIMSENGKKIISNWLGIST